MGHMLPSPITDEEDWDYMRLRLFQLFRWTPETVDNLDAHTYRQIWASIGAQMTYKSDVQWFP